MRKSQPKSPRKTKRKNEPKSSKSGSSKTGKGRRPKIGEQAEFLRYLLSSPLDSVLGELGASRRDLLKTIKQLKGEDLLVEPTDRGLTIDWFGKKARVGFEIGHAGELWIADPSAEGQFHTVQLFLFLLHPEAQALSPKGNGGDTLLRVYARAVQTFVAQIIGGAYPGARIRFERLLIAAGEPITQLPGLLVPWSHGELSEPAQIRKAARFGNGMYVDKRGLDDGSYLAIAKSLGEVANTQGFGAYRQIAEGEQILRQHGVARFRNWLLQRSDEKSAVQGEPRLYLQFSDGTVLSALDSICHPYQIALPQGLRNFIKELNEMPSYCSDDALPRSAHLVTWPNDRPQAKGETRSEHLMNKLRTVLFYVEAAHAGRKSTTSGKGGEDPDLVLEPRRAELSKPAIGKAPAALYCPDAAVDAGQRPVWPARLRFFTTAMTDVQFNADASVNIGFAHKEASPAQWGDGQRFCDLGNGWFVLAPSTSRSHDDERDPTGAEAQGGVTACFSHLLANLYSAGWIAGPVELCDGRLRIAALRDNAYDKLNGWCVAAGAALDRTDVPRQSSTALRLGLDQVHGAQSPAVGEKVGGRGAQRSRSDGGAADIEVGYVAPDAAIGASQSEVVGASAGSTSADGSNSGFDGPATYAVGTALLNLVGSGIGYLEHHRDIAVISTSPKRQNDLKLLRHQGFSRLMCYTAMRHNAGSLAQCAAQAMAEIAGLKSSEVETVSGLGDERLRQLYGRDLLRYVNRFVSLLERNAAIAKADAIEPQKGAAETDANGNRRRESKAAVVSGAGGTGFDYARDVVEHILTKNENGLTLAHPFATAMHLACQLIDALLPSYGADLFNKEKIRSLTIRPTQFLLGMRYNTPILSALPSSGLLPLLAVSTREAQRVALDALALGQRVLIEGEEVGRMSAGEFQARLKLNEDNDGDWFDLHPEVFFNGQPVKEEELTEILQGGVINFRGQLYLVDHKTVPSAKWLSYFWEKIRGGERGVLGKSAGAGRPWGEDGTIIAQEPSRVLNLMAMKLSGLDVVGGERWRQIEQRLERLFELGNVSGRQDGAEGELEAAVASTGIPLKAFQRRGAEWMLTLEGIGLGGILADDMGLGKTVQTIAFLQALETQERLGNTLIVVPTSLVHNWGREIERFAPQMRYAAFLGKGDLAVLESFYGQDERAGAVEGDGGRPKILITTYGLIERYAAELQEIDWHLHIYDEAQQLKNIKSKRTGIARQLKAASRFCLSGTPLENHYGEYFSLIDLCVPGALGGYKEFSARYIPSRSRTSDAIRTVDPDDVAFLRKKTAALVLRRTKAAILSELPPKTETVISLDFESKQKRIYKETALSWNRSMAKMIAARGESNVQLEMLTALMRMRQICSFPQVVPQITYSGTPPKMERLGSMLLELHELGESAVVFTNFKSSLHLIEAELRDLGLDVLVMTGDTPVAKRAAVLQRFDDADKPVVLLMTQKVGGVGLNLTRASYVFHVEPWWNPQVENQATDRVHRIGQTQAVQVYRLIMGESIEEKIEELKKQKTRDFELLLDANDIEDEAGLGATVRGTPDKKAQDGVIYLRQLDVPASKPSADGGAGGRSNAFGKSRLSKDDFVYLLS